MGNMNIVELDEVSLIDRPANVASVESGHPVQQTPGRSPEEVEVTRKVRVDSSSIV